MAESVLDDEFDTVGIETGELTHAFLNCSNVAERASVPASPALVGRHSGADRVNARGDEAAFPLCLTQREDDFGGCAGIQHRRYAVVEIGSRRMVEDDLLFLWCQLKRYRKLEMDMRIDQTRDDKLAGPGDHLRLRGRFQLWPERAQRHPGWFCILNAKNAILLTQKTPGSLRSFLRFKEDLINSGFTSGSFPAEIASPGF